MRLVRQCCQVKCTGCEARMKYSQRIVVVMAGWLRVNVKRTTLSILPSNSIAIIFDVLDDLFVTAEPPTAC